MPALKAIITADARALNAELDKSLVTASQWAKKVKSNTGGSYASVVTADEAANIIRTGKGLGEASEAAHLPLRLLKKELKYVGGAFGEIAHIAIYSFKSPIMWAIGGVIAAIYGLKKALDWMQPKAAINTKSLAPHLENFGDKIVEARAKVATFFNELSRGRTEVEKLNDAMKDAENIATSWSKSDDAILEAQKSLALARAGNNRVLRAQIENQYELRKIERENQRRLEDRERLRAEADKAEALSNKKAAEVGGLSEASLAAERLKDANAERIKNAKDNIEALEKARVGKTSVEFGEIGGFGALKLYTEALEKLRAGHVGLVAAAEKAGDALKRAEQDAIALKKDAEEKRREAERKFVQSAAQYKADREAAALKAKERMILPEIKANLNALQKQGAYAGGGNLLDVNKRMERHLATLVTQNQRRSVDQTQPRF